MVSGSPDVYLHLSPFVCLLVLLLVSGSLDVCLHLLPFMCLPGWLVVSGSPDVSPNFVSSSPFMCRLLSGCLSLLVSVHLSPSVASGIRLSADVSLYLFCFIPKEIYCWKLGSSILSWEASSCLLVLVPGSLGDSLYLSPFICLPECLVVSGRMSLCTCFPLLLPVCLVRLGR